MDIVNCNQFAIEKLVYKLIKLEWINNLLNYNSFIGFEIDSQLHIFLIKDVDFKLIKKTFFFANYVTLGNLSFHIN